MARDIITEREEFSKEKLLVLKEELKKLNEAKDFEHLTIVGAGSFARHEGSTHSDIDLFLFCNKSREEIETPKTKELALFGKLIKLIDELNFPPFSADSKFLHVFYLDDAKDHLGSPLDDHHNFFTARMLLLLESKCLFNEEVYNQIVTKIIAFYYADYPKHKNSFFPTFLINDITRYWKTILLNYENKRGKIFHRDRHGIDDKKIKQKVKNFKLKYSRMTTCFATIAAIGSYDRTVNEKDIKRLVSITPRERLKVVSDNIPSLKDSIETINKDYCWFLEKTALSTEELTNLFYVQENRDKYFDKAKEYGDAIFKLLMSINETHKLPQDLIRILVL